MRILSSKTFSYVKVFNQVAGACVICLVALLAVVMLFERFRHYTRSVYAQNVLNTSEVAEISQNLKLGYPEAVSGQNVLMIPLYSEQTYTQGFRDKHALGNAVNYLFFDGRSKTSNWLFETSDDLIVDVNRVPSGTNSAQPTRVIVYALARRDTNGNGRLDPEDALTIGISRPDGKGYKTLLESVSDYSGLQMLNPMEVSLVFASDGKNRIVTVSLDDFTTIDEQVIPDTR
ncbi:hypothetical protein [Coralliovum pocilloporae]|uniref:hypothetical protein n=1 Tax=Coralliovum pocilloporae TaxID=3066369 RepID=UPI003306FA32